jgi:hypothetical protein
MLSQQASRVPTGAQWLYEPKFDGFRGLLCQSSDGLVRLTSRQGKDLTDWFPELAQAGKCLPRSTVLDGEISSPMTKGAQTSALFSDGWESLRGAVRQVRRSVRRFYWSSTCSSVPFEYDTVARGSTHGSAAQGPIVP